MSDLNETEHSVNGSDFTSRMKEIAAENDIQLNDEIDTTEAPEGEGSVEEVIEGQLEQESTIEGSDEPSNVESDSEDVPADSTEELPKGFRKQLQRKERQLFRERKEHEQAMNQLRSEFEELKKSTQKPKQKLTKENFRNTEEYVKYLANEEAQSIIQKQNESQRLQEQNLQKYEEMKTSWEDKIQKNFTDQKQLQEYAEAVQEFGNPSQHFSQDVIQYMLQHENGPKILYHFAENPSNVQRFNNMHLWDKLSYIQNISNGFSAETPKQVSKAPAPVGNLKNKSTMSKSIDDMNDDELLARYREKGQSMFS